MQRVCFIPGIFHQAFDIWRRFEVRFSAAVSDKHVWCFCCKRLPPTSTNLVRELTPCCEAAERLSACPPLCRQTPAADPVVVSGSDSAAPRLWVTGGRLRAACAAVASRLCDPSAPPAPELRAAVARLAARRRRWSLGSDVSVESALDRFSFLQSEDGECKVSGDGGDTVHQHVSLIVVEKGWISCYCFRKSMFFEQQNLSFAS